MNKEKSCGAVVFTVIDTSPHFVLVRNKRGDYGFPKGHVEGTETERETATREIFEETGLTVDFLDGFRTSDTYVPPGLDVLKDVVYFLARFDGQTPVAQEDELSGIALVSHEEARELLRFDVQRRILDEAREFLRNN